MSVLRGDCVEVMAGMEPDSVDALVTDPPYGLEFMGKEWDSLGKRGRHTGTERKSVMGVMGFKDFKTMPNFGTQSRNPKCKTCGKYQWDHAERKCVCETPQFENRHMGAEQYAFHANWATAALRVAKPGAYLLAFGGTRTVHRMTCALEDAGWVIRDMLVWAYAQGFPKSRASLKPAWEPIVLARKPGASRDLNIDAARLPISSDDPDLRQSPGVGNVGVVTYGEYKGGSRVNDPSLGARHSAKGRWPANVILTDPILDGGWEGVVGGGWQSGGGNPRWRSNEAAEKSYGGFAGGDTGKEPTDTEGTYSRFFLIPKAPRSERVLSGGRRSPHPTQKPEALIRHLVTLVTPPGGLVLDPFLGSGTLGVVCEGLGMRWQGIEREPEYADWAEARIADKAPAWEAA